MLPCGWKRESSVRLIKSTQFDTSTPLLPSTLKPGAAQVLAAIVEGKSVSQAARENGIHRSTIYTWIHHSPAFAAALRQLTEERTLAISDQLLEISGDALDTIRHLVTSEDVPPAVRLRAALAVVQAAKRTEITLPGSVDETNPISPQTPRNSPCPCGSGLKFKRCCGAAAPPILHSGTTGGLAAGV
jgi:uncharacterized protein YchJ